MVNNINEISNPAKVKANFRKYKGNDDAKLELSKRKIRDIRSSIDGKAIHFGSTMPDFTKTQNEDKRRSYLAAKRRHQRRLESK